MSGYDQKLQPALRFMRENFRRSLSVPEIAATAQLSAPHFGQVFFRHVGKTVNELLNEMRIAAASHELRTSDKRIGKIATEVGFTHRRHFTRVFQTLTGCAPRDYRRQIAGTEPVFAHPLTRHVTGLMPRCRCGHGQLVWVARELKCAACRRPAQSADDLDEAFADDMLHNGHAS